MRFPLLLGVLLCAQLIFAQDTDQFKFAKPTQEQANITSFPKDSTANALVLYEWGNSYIDRQQDNAYVFNEYVVRIKILKKKGVDKAIVEIPLQKNTKRKAELVKVRAASIDPITRKVVALKQEEVYTTNQNEYWDVARFTIPAAKEGSIIDYYYKVRTPFTFNFNTWWFQEDIPKLYSEYNTSIPANYKYHIKLVGYQQLDDRKESIKKSCYEIQGWGTSDCVRNKYIMKDIPAFIKEDYMTSSINHKSHISFELNEYHSFDGSKQRYSKEWKHVDREFKKNEEIGKESKRSKYFKKTLPAVLFTEADPLKKAKGIYNFLQEELRWNESYEIFKGANTKKAWDAKVGSIAELNLILLNALKAADISADFMLISTRNRGIPTKLYPVISEFNYLVIKTTIDGKDYLLDISGKELPFGQLPYKALNSYGRVMDFKNGSYWMDIKVKSPTVNSTSIFFDILEDGSSNGKISIIRSGYAANKKRRLLKKGDTDQYLSDIEAKIEDISIEDYEVKNLTDNEKLLKETISFKREPEVTNPSTYFVYPFIMTNFSENPFKLQERNYPVDFGYKQSFRYQISINVDPVYEIVELPAKVGYQLSDKGAIVRFSAEQKGQKININASLNIRKDKFSPEQYFELKEVFGHFVDIQNKRPIVLKRKDP